MEQKLAVDISIEGTTIEHFNSFTLRQAFNEHHYFELRYNHDELGEPGLVTLEDSRDFVGKNLTIQFGALGGDQQSFTGIVTKVELAQSHGYHGVVIVSGFSPSILIDRGPDMGSYLSKDLSTIIRQATQDTPSNDLRISLNPARTAPIDYIIQYRESDFAFINRLSAEYFEWFYYDGVQLNFGKPAQQGADVDVVYGRDVQSLQYGIQVAPLKYRKFAYNPIEDEIFSSESASGQNSQPDLSFAVQASNTVYSQVYNQPTPVRIDTKSDIDTHVSNESKALVSDLLKVSAGGDNPMVRLGGIVNIDMSLRQDLAFSTQNLGRFLVTSVFHQLDGLGHYYNSFDGVVADTECIPVRSYDKPEPDLQLAIVLDNNDPKKQGRVKVSFKWDCNSNDPTEWLRVASPNAGKGDLGDNRGFIVVPEVGDQVVVGFEEGNIARPLILGCVYHGKNVNSGGFVNSNIKALNSRRGSTLTFDDQQHLLFLQTDGGNFLKMEKGPGNVTIQAASQIVLRTGDSSITLNKDGTISLVGKIINIQGTDSVNVNAANNTGANVTLGTAGKTTLTFTSQNTTVHADANLGMDATGGANLTSPAKITISGGETDIN